MNGGTLGCWQLQRWQRGEGGVQWVTGMQLSVHRAMYWRAAL